LLGGETQAGKDTGNQENEQQRLKDSHGDSGQIGCLLCVLTYNYLSLFDQGCCTEGCMEDAKLTTIRLNSDFLG
jgi:hypothetical protein